MDRVFIVHGWDGAPDEGCFPWLKMELEKSGYAVFAPEMPNPLRPHIETWVKFLEEQVGAADEHTYFVGHSIGCQTILRYLATLPEGTIVGGVALLAPWVHLTEEAFEDDEDVQTAKPWLEAPLEWPAIRAHAKGFTAIFSDNDPVVPLSDSKIFEEKLGASILIEHDKEHFSGSSGIKELPKLLGSVLEFRRIS